MQAMGQIFSVLFGLDLIKKPVSAVIGGTKKIFHGAYEVHIVLLIILFMHFIRESHMELVSSVKESSKLGVEVKVGIAVTQPSS